MARKFLTHLDLVQNELQNAVIQRLSSDPSTPVEGQFYYNTTSDVIKYYDGAAWQVLGTGSGSGDMLAATYDPQNIADDAFARANHTGTQLLATISDVTASASEVNILDGATLSTTELNYVTGVTSSIQTQLDAKSTASKTETLTNKTIDANGTGNSISNLEVADFASGVIDTSTNLGTSNTKLPTQNAVKVYVDNAVQGLSWKQAVRVATTTAGTLASSFENGDTIDGVTLATGDRILIKDQGTGADNGIYVVNATGAPTRATDADSSAEIDSMAVYVESGTVNADTVWTLTTDNPTLGSTSLTFAQINGGALPSATTTTQGKVELATQAEAQAKTDTDRALTPASVADFARKYTGTIGDNSSTSIAVTHGLGSQYVTAQVFDASSGALVECDITLTSSTQTTFGFSVAPTTNQYRVVITG